MNMWNSISQISTKNRFGVDEIPVVGKRADVSFRDLIRDFAEVDDGASMHISVIKIPEKKRIQRCDCCFYTLSRQLKRCSVTHEMLCGKGKTVTSGTAEHTRRLLPILFTKKDSAKIKRG